MTSNSHFLRAVFVFLLLACSPLAFGLEFRLLGWNGSDDTLKFENRGTITELSVHGDTLSLPYEFNGAGPLVLFREIERDGKTIRQTVATLPLPEGLEKGILLLSSAGPTRSSYDGRWLDDSLETRPVGTIELHNFSKLPIALKIDGQEMLLSPQEKRQFAFRMGVKRLPFLAAARTNGTWEHFAGNPLPVRADHRVLVILRDARRMAGNDHSLIDTLLFLDPPPPAGVSVTRRD